MATTLKATVVAQIDAVYSNLLDLGSAIDNLSKRTKIELVNGTVGGAADRMFHDQRTLNASSSEDLDLAGSLVNEFGATLTFVEIRAVMITAAAGNTNNVLVSRPASNGVPLFSAAGDELIIPPGGAFLWACGTDGKIPVTPSTGDLLHVANSSSGSSVTYDVVIIGTSA